MKTELESVSYVLFIGITLTVFFSLFLPLTSEAHRGHDHATSTATSTREVGGKNMDATCMAAAVEVREAALTSAWEEMSAGLIAALKDRKDALVSAWNSGSVSERAQATNKAWKEWRADKKAIDSEFRNDRKAAWETFKKTAKNECKMTLPKEEVLEKPTSDSVAL